MFAAQGGHDETVKALLEIPAESDVGAEKQVHYL